jgi:hypothetical protein
MSWPGADELKKVLNVESDDWDDTLDRLLAAAIDKVKMDVAGSVEDFDDADPVIQISSGMSAAALRMAELMALKPEFAAGSARDPSYERLLFGSRRTFGVA